VDRSPFWGLGAALRDHSTLGGGAAHPGGDAGLGGFGAAADESGAAGEPEQPGADLGGAKHAK
jgi:hypothetical protein